MISEGDQSSTKKFGFLNSFFTHRTFAVIYRMKNIKGPAIFLAQFLSDEPPFNNLKSICKWAASFGFVGVQIPTWDSRVINLKLAAESKDYADELRGTVESCGL